MGFKIFICFSVLWGDEWNKKIFINIYGTIYKLIGNNLQYFLKNFFFLRLCNSLKIAGVYLKGFKFIPSDCRIFL